MVYVGSKLYPKQKEIADGIITSDKMYHIIDAGRQVGKSYLCQQLLLYFAINNRRWQCMYVSMTYAQTNKLYKELLNAIKGSGIIKSFNRIENSIILKNDSEIYFKSYQNADAIRGYSNDLLIIDEAAFLDDDDFYKVFRPTLAAKGKKCILCSSPRGYNYFYELWQSGNNGEGSYQAYFANYTTCPFANLEEVADAKKKLPDKIFRSEYLGEFIDGSMSVFSGYKECVGISVQGGKTFAAIDVGRQNDFTVLTIMQGKKVVYQNRWNNDTWAIIVSKIVEQIVKYKPVNTFVEVNGVGDVFYELLYNALKKLNISGGLQTWTTTNLTKSNIIEQLINDFNNKRISIPNDKELLSELASYEAAYSKAARVITYNARNGHNDDCVMSLAICNWVAEKNTKVGEYFFDFV